MKTRQISPRHRPSGARGYTLVEVLFATVITSFMFFAALSAITFSKVELARDKERGIANDFAIHYMETLRGMNFDDLVPGNPISSLHDGVGANEFSQKMTIRVPASGTWVPISGASYEMFTPDLPWLAPRSPEYSLTLTPTTVAGTVRTRMATLQVRWHAPLGKGNQQMLRMDMLRLRDIETGQ